VGRRRPGARKIRIGIERASGVWRPGDGIERGEDSRGRRVLAMEIEGVLAMEIEEIEGVGGEGVGQSWRARSRSMEKRRSRSNFGREQATSAGN
jgi:hypothetical protein